jgi:methionine-S-sulfoxide reductase
MTFPLERKEFMHKLTVIYLLGFLALCFLSTTYASGAETRSSVSENKLEKATFAGGCFWCMQPPFDKLDGVISTTVGYCGGKEENPTYKQVSAGNTGHAEAVEILYDPSRISYADLLNVFWMNIDPTQENGQFADTGAQYRTAIFYHNEEQKRLAETSKKELKNTGKFSKKIVTQIVPATPFYRAEEYHQDYYKKNPLRYKIYRYGSGRDDYLVRKWGKK